MHGHLKVAATRPCVARAPCAAARQQTAIGYACRRPRVQPAAPAWPQAGRCFAAAGHTHTVSVPVLGAGAVAAEQPWHDVGALLQRQQIAAVAGASIKAARNNELYKQQAQQHRSAGDATSAARVPEACITASAVAAPRLGQRGRWTWQVTTRSASNHGGSSGGSAAAAPPVATLSLTRLLLSGQNSAYLRGALSRRGRNGNSGAASLLLFSAATIVAAALAAVRNAIVRRVKACRDCRGFGVCRCSLCKGEGRVSWSAKLLHADVCPLCINRRYVVCSGCGGMYHRPLFAHAARRPSQSEWDEIYGVFTASGAGTAAPAAPGAAVAFERSISAARHD